MIDVVAAITVTPLRVNPARYSAGCRASVPFPPCHGRHMGHPRSSPHVGDGAAVRSDSLSRAGGGANCLQHLLTAWRPPSRGSAGLVLCCPTVDRIL